VESAPRNHHYNFAHRVLRSVSDTQPDVLFKGLSGDRAAKMLADLWKMSANGVEPDQVLSDDGLRREVHQSSRGEPIVVVICPDAIGITEAHFVAIVSTEAGLRYFTLEASIDFETNADITVLCEWIEGRHLNFGRGPDPTVSAFLDAIEPKLSPVH
jgi:hypothetical protein